MDATLLPVLDALRVHARSRLPLDIILFPRGRHASPIHAGGRPRRDGAAVRMAETSVPPGLAYSEYQPHEQHRFLGVSGDSSLVWLNK